ncbi:MAG TPA: twin-arginine translocase TatA/TatE family subunit [Myxococcota bacterium]|jgi:sec-independent protein translocase protein TatA|nr:twin-arginine translocase TatA/TatE family subunit [Myxococcota bacterium]
MLSLLGFGVGATELIIILVIVLVLFGAGKLPQVGEALGKGIRNFKRSASGEDEIDITAKKSAGAAAPREIDEPPTRAGGAKGEITDASVVEKKS